MSARRPIRQPERMTMALPVPNLDDRRFQDLVDDAKRLVQQRCPEWTDHNVSDPGVTLIELFAWMTDQLIYRLNRVPDRNYVKFLELIGRQPLPADRGADPGHLLADRAPAGRRRGSRPGPRSRPSGPRPTRRSSSPRPSDLPIVPVLARRARLDDRRQDVPRPVGRPREGHRPVLLQARSRRPGDALYVGLTDAVPSNAVRLRFKCHIEGVGVDPTNPPLVWEAWNGEDWERVRARLRRRPAG